MSQSIPRKTVLEAIKKARLDHRARIFETVAAWESFGVQVADVGEAMAFAYALGCVVEDSSVVSDYYIRLAETARMVHPSDGDPIVVFVGWNLEG